jgi:PRTRC genetic system ThiF family protein
MIYNYLANPTHPIYIAVIGAGGTGSHVLSSLAQIAHALNQLERQQIHVTAYDPDIVTENNIGRQLFSPADFQRNKAEVLVERINRFYGFNWHAVSGVFEPVFAKPHNIIISCVDTLASRESIWKAIDIMVNSVGTYYLKPFYWLDIGNERNHGQAVMKSLQETEKSNPDLPGLFDLFPRIIEENIDEACSAHMIYNKQNLFINKIMATLACNMLWELLFKYFIDYHGFFVNLGERYSINKLPVKAKEVKLEKTKPKRKTKK